MAVARILSALTLAAVATVLIAPAASAAPVSANINGITYTADDANLLAGASATAYDGTGQGSTVVIDAVVDIGGTNYDVTSIGIDAFNNENLSSVTIPSSVIIIEARAFFDNALTSVTIPTSVTTIGAAAFQDNPLSSIIIPNSVTTIGESAFRNNQLTSVTIPDSVTTIRESTFLDNLLTSVSLGNSVTTIENFAFQNNLLTSITIPGSVTSMADGPFANNPGLTAVRFLGAAPASIGPVPFGSTGGASGPLLSYYERNAGSGYTSPFWPVGAVDYRSQSLVTVTFDANGRGTAPAAADVVLNSSLANPGALSAPGFAFDGWFTAASGGTAVNFAAGPSADATYYGRWSATLADTGVATAPTLALAVLLTLSGVALVAGQRRRAE